MAGLVEVGSHCTAFVVWCQHHVGWAFAVHKASVDRKTYSVFAHIRSKTGCCTGYRFEFIKLNTLHAQMAVSPWASSFTSLLPLCVIQLILHPSGGSAAVGEGKGALCVVCITDMLTWNPYWVPRQLLGSVPSVHFYLQFTCRYWQSSRKLICPCDAPREKDQGWWCSFPL